MITRERTRDSGKAFFTHLFWPTKKKHCSLPYDTIPPNMHSLYPNKPSKMSFNPFLFLYH